MQATGLRLPATAQASTSNTCKPSSGSLTLFLKGVMLSCAGHGRVLHQAQEEPIVAGTWAVSHHACRKHTVHPQERRLHSQHLLMGSSGSEVRTPAAGHQQDCPQHRSLPHVQVTSLNRLWVVFFFPDKSFHVFQYNFQHKLEELKPDLGTTKFVANSSFHSCTNCEETTANDNARTRCGAAAGEEAPCL